MRVAQGAYIFGCSGTALTPREAAFFRDADPFGFILFARNVDTPERLERLTGALRDSVGRDAPVLIDQEGGRVARLGPPHWRAWAPALDDAAAAGPKAAPRAFWLRARLIAAELREAGIDTNCAPLADIAGPGTHPFLRNRCYGESAPAVIAAARATAEGLAAGGVLPVLKHLPGHGRAGTDSHLALPRVTASRQTLAAEDFAAFAALADLPMAMTAHIVFDALDADRPATASPAAIAAIRGQIGFGGLLMTDDIGMGALSGDMALRSRAALEAGCDVILHCNGDAAEMECVAAAAGRMPAAAQARADAALAARPAVDATDLAAALAEYRALTGADADANA